MSIKNALLGFVGKYGPHSKLIASSVLNVIAPGSGALISITETALDAAKDIADNIDHKNWEKRLMAKVDQGQEEMERLSNLIELLSGPLATVCDRAATFADDPEELADAISRAIAKDPSLSQTLHEVQSLKTQFDVFHKDLRKIARNQEEVMPVYDRMNRVADYFDELWHAGIKPRDFVHQVASHRQVASQIQQGNTADVDDVIDELREATPKAASVCVLEAAAATREFNYLSAQRALNKAVKLRPDDRELANIANQVTAMATQTSKRPKASVPTQSERRLQPGDTLDGWALESRRGAGGWGQVFKANKRNKTKAIKVMHPELAADPTFLERFKKEIAALWGLPKHPNLLAIDKPERSFGFCMDHQTWYLAMEYIDGPTLESYLATQGEISELLVHQVFSGVIDGLAQAHGANIVHRDIKPGNMIFRKSDQRLVLVDFGLAVGVEDFGETKVGGISIQFAAPEQHYGGSANKSSDVFSLCAVMHYALNYDDPDRRAPHAFDRSLAPDSLREVLSKGIVMTPQQRFKNAGELLDALGKRETKKETVVNATLVPVPRNEESNKEQERNNLEAAHQAELQLHEKKESARKLAQEKQLAAQRQQLEREKIKRAEENRRDAEPPPKPPLVEKKQPSGKADAKSPAKKTGKSPSGTRTPGNSILTNKEQPKPAASAPSVRTTAADRQPMPLATVVKPVAAAKPPAIGLFLGLFGIPLAILLIWHGWYLSQTPVINYWLNTWVSRLATGFGISLVALTAGGFTQARGMSSWTKAWCWSALVYSILLTVLWGGFAFESASDERSVYGEPAEVEAIAIDLTPDDYFPSDRALIRDYSPKAFGLMFYTFVFTSVLLIRTRRKPAQALFKRWDTAEKSGEKSASWPVVLGVTSILLGAVNVAGALLLGYLLGGTWWLPCAIWTGVGIWLVASAVGIMMRQPWAIKSIKVWCIASLIIQVTINIWLARSQPAEIFWDQGIMTVPLNLLWSIAMPVIWLLWLRRPDVAQLADKWKDKALPKWSAKQVLAVAIPCLFVFAITIHVWGSSVRSRADDAITRNRMRSIAEAINEFVDDRYDRIGARNSYPGAATPIEKKGPEVSWRVKILKGMGYRKLYERYDITQPWDSPENKELIPLMPDELISAGVSTDEKGFTRFQVVVDPDSIFPPNSDSRSGQILASSIRDGRSNTILFVESEFARPWTEPRDISGTKLGVESLMIRSGNSVLIAFADGTVKTFRAGVPVSVLRSLMHRDDGDYLDPENYVIGSSSRSDTDNSQGDSE